MQKRRKRFKWLVIAPIKVCETVWRQEAKIWEHTQHLKFKLIRGDKRDRAFALSREADVYLINPELVPWLVEYLRGNLSMFKGLIVDESSLFKDHRSKRFRALTNYGTRVAKKGPDGKALRDSLNKIIPIDPYKFQRSVIFTGTPRPQSAMNLWSQIYILDHGKRLHKNFDTFRSRYFKAAGKVTKHVKRFTENDDAKIEDGYKPHDGAPEKIHEMIADISVELNAEEMGILPPIIDTFHYADLPEALRPEYEKLERDAIMELTENPVIAVNGGVKSMMCWQFANGAIYNPMVDAKGKRTWTLLHDALLDEAEAVIEQLDQNVLIAIQFQHDRARVMERFKDAVILPRQAEKTVEEWNRGEIGKLVLHPKSGSHGLNIQYGGWNLVLFGMFWSNEQYRQLIRRLARPGQPHPFVNVHHLITRRTVHELQYASLVQKGGEEKRFRNALDMYQKAKGLGMHVKEYMDEYASEL